MEARDLKRPSIRAHIYDEIEAERDRQISLGYTPEHDTAHGGLSHLMSWVLTYATEADNCAFNRKWGRGAEKYAQRLRPSLIKMIAVAVAALELLDAENVPTP